MFDDQKYVSVTNMDNTKKSGRGQIFLQSILYIGSDSNLPLAVCIPVYFVSVLYNMYVVVISVYYPVCILISIQQSANIPDSKVCLLLFEIHTNKTSKWTSTVT